MSTVYVSKDGKSRVRVDESDRVEVTHYRALGFRPQKSAKSKPAESPKVPESKSGDGA